MELFNLNLFISAVSSIVMVIIWIAYLHIAFRQFRLSHRPLLLVHRAHNSDPKAPCLFVNMSKEPVHVSCVIVNVQNINGFARWYITDYDRISSNDEKVQTKLRQGPVSSGGYLILGSFWDIISTQASERQNKDIFDQTKPSLSKPSLSEIKSFEICVAVVHGGSKYHIGARRRFFIEQEDDRLIIRSYNIYTEQLLSRKKRKIVRKWVESHVDPKHIGKSETSNAAQNNQRNDDQANHGTTADSQN